MRALMIDDEERVHINRVIALAAMNPISTEDLLAAKHAKGDALLRWKHRLDDYTMELPFGFLVTYTREHHPGGLCHHLNVSIGVKGQIPEMATIAIICTEFGMRQAAKQLQGTASEAILGIWPEYYDNGRVGVHIVGPIQEDRHG